MSYCPVAGIDVSKRFSDMCILSPDNKIFAQEKIYHDETSINRANALLQKAERLFFRKPVIVMESTSHYHLILFQFFSEHGYDVIVVNPLQSNSMKDFSIRKRKTDRVDLLSNFTLKGKPSNIDFDHLDNNLAQVDLDGDGTPRASKMESQYQQFIGQQFPLMPGENRLKLCRNIIHTTLSRQKKLNAVDDTELQRYVDYIIGGMNQDQLDALEQMPINFANKICDYIIKLQEETARENFYNWLEVGKIVTQPRFKLTSHITLSGKASSLTKSLYKQECELDDNFEYDMAMALTGIDSVRWWHRNPTSGRNAFCLNAFRNHYPDFIVMTNSGKVLLVETKGDQLENAESREKIKLGRAWQNAAGSQYRYYMVFQNKDLHLEGAYRFDEFLKILGEL